MVEEHSTLVLVWWAGLSAVALVNVGLWLKTRSLLSGNQGVSEEARAYRRIQWILSGGFVLGCASRSLVPRADVQRFTLIDSWFASVAVGRSIATVAELCFMAQLAYLLYSLARRAANRPLQLVAMAVLPLIFTAECFSWYSVITTNYIGNTVEESLWALSETLLTIGALLLWPTYDDRLKRFIRGGLVFGIGYVAFMCTVDVPMYFTRWRADTAAGKAYFSLREGLYDVSHRWVVTFSAANWDGEKAWMLLYFTAAVWLSLAVIRAPLFRDSVEERRHPAV